MGPLDSDSLVEYNEKLCGEIDWRLRNMWRDDYRNVIKEGFRVMSMASNHFLHINDLQDLFATGALDLPTWMGHRAARFVRFAKEKHWEADGKPIVCCRSSHAGFFVCTHFYCSLSLLQAFPRRISRLLYSLLS